MAGVKTVVLTITMNPLDHERAVTGPIKPRSYLAEVFSKGKEKGKSFAMTSHSEPHLS